MAAPRKPAKGGHKPPEGKIRLGQLVMTFGPGAMVDLLEPYFQRIGYAGPREPTRATLDGIVASAALTRAANKGLEPLRSVRICAAPSDDGASAGAQHWWCRRASSARHVQQLP